MIGFKLCKNGSFNDIDDSYILEFKFDGVRCMLIKKDGEINLINREQNNITKYFPEIVNEGKRLRDGIYDGEIICGNYEDGKRVWKNCGDFHKIQKRFVEDKRKINLLSKTIPSKYVIFDYICDKSLLERKKIIEQIIPLQELITYKHITTSPCFHYSKLDDLWKTIKQLNLEGLVAKRKDSYYNDLRNDEWIKIKNRKDIVIEFDKYEKHEAGVLLIKGDLRVNLNGKESEKAIELIEKQGFVKCEVEYLDKEESGLLRQGVVKRVV